MIEYLVVFFVLVLRQFDCFDLGAQFINLRKREKLYLLWIVQSQN
jgi:hypothetical protein